MSTTVDERVVQMRFENGDFEKNIQQSMESIERMDKQIDEFGKTTKSVDGIAASVEGISKSFTTLGKVGTAVIYKLTSSLYDLGASFIKSVTVDQVAEGFNKYESSLKSVKTMMAATGDTLEDVESVMERLMKYSDETSYSYSQMAMTMSKFTNAGASAAMSETILEGISNVGALAGKAANEMSVAYFNWAQAYSAGAMKSRDWLSIVQQGLNTTWFQEEALRTAESLGYIAEASEGVYVTTQKLKEVTGTKAGKELGAFNESLQLGWFQKDVIEEVFATFADSTQGIGQQAYEAAKEYRTFGDVISTVKDVMSTQMSMSYKYVFGNAEEAAELWTKVGDTMLEIVAGPLYEFNDALAQWKSGGGRDYLLRALADLWDSITRITSSIKAAFDDVFPKNWLQSLYQGGVWISKFAKKIKLSNDGMDNLYSFAKGIFSLFKAGINIVKRVISAITGLVDINFDTILGFLGSIGEFFTNITANSANTEALNGAINGIGDASSYAWRMLKKVWGVLKKIPSMVSSFIEVHPEIQTALSNIWNFIKDIPDKVAAILPKIRQVISDISDGFSKLKNQPFITEFTDKVKTMFTKTSSEASDAFEDVSFLDKLKNAFSKALPYLEAAGAVGMAVVVSKVFKNLIDGLTTIFSGGLIGAIFGSDLTSSLSSTLDAITESTLGLKRAEAASTLMTFAKAILMLAAALAVLSYLESKGNLEKAIGDIMVLMLIFTVTISSILKTMGKVGLFSKGSSPAKTFTNLKEFLMSTLTDLKGLGDSFLRMKLGLTSNPFKNVATLIKAFADAILEIAFSVLIIATALKYFPEETSTALWGVAGAIIALGLITLLIIKKLSKLTAESLAAPKMLTALGASFLMIAAGLLLIAGAVAIVASIKEPNVEALSALATIVLVISVVLGIVAAISAWFASKSTSESAATAIAKIGKILAKIGWAFILISAGIWILANALSIVGAIPAEGIQNGVKSLITIVSIVSGLIAVVAILSIIADKLGVSGSISTAMIALGTAFLMASAGLYLIAQSLAIVASVGNSLDSNANSAVGTFLAITAIIAVVIVAVGMMATFLGKGFEVAGVMAAVGAAFLMIGATIYIIANAVATLASIQDPSAATQSMWNLVALLSAVGVALVILTALSNYTGGVGNILGVAAAMLAIGITVALLANSIRMLASVGDVASNMWAMIVPIIALTAIVAALSLVAPEASAIGLAILAIGAGCALAAVGVLILVVAFGLMAAIFVVITGLLIQFASQIAASGSDISNALVVIAQIVRQGTSMIVSAFVQGLAEAVMNTLAELTLIFFYVGFGAVSGFIVGVIAGLIAGIAQVGAIVKDMWKSIFSGDESVTEWGDKIAKDMTKTSEKATNNDIVNEVKSQNGNVENATESLALSGISGFSILEGGLASSANYSVDGVVGAITSRLGELSGLGSDMANAISGGYNSSMEIHSPSKKMADSGRWTVRGAMVGLQEEAGNLENVATSISERTADALTFTTASAIGLNQGNNGQFYTVKSRGELSGAELKSAFNEVVKDWYWLTTTGPNNNPRKDQISAAIFDLQKEVKSGNRTAESFMAQVVGMYDENKELLELEEKYGYGTDPVYNPDYVIDKYGTLDTKYLRDYYKSDNILSSIMTTEASKGTAKLLGSSIGYTITRYTEGVKSNDGRIISSDLEETIKLMRHYEASEEQIAEYVASHSSSSSSASDSTEPEVKKVYRRRRVNPYKAPDYQDEGGSYTFVQNNYSPKALSRIQIYRQTSNQFNNWKGGSSYSYDTGD